jgi:hypothetical protein
MLDLDKIVPGARVQGLDASGPVAMVGATPYGDTAVKIAFEVEATGQPENRVLFRWEAEDLELPRPIAVGPSTPTHGSFASSWRPSASG